MLIILLPVGRWTCTGASTHIFIRSSIKLHVYFSGKSYNNVSGTCTCLQYTFSIRPRIQFLFLPSLYIFVFRSSFLEMQWGARVSLDSFTTTLSMWITLDHVFGQPVNCKRWRSDVIYKLFNSGFQFHKNSIILIFVRLRRSACCDLFDLLS